ncbi:MAG TPA: glycosyltransferase family 87 protein, partial [Gemmatimonadales bacterium]|nr:glycosyltransferase family 87 protein [Gemmatimonadales bacterium]
LHRQPLYLTPPTQGTWWPPFSTLAIVPFALIAGASLGFAKGLWAALGVWCFGWSLWTAGTRWGWRAAWLAVAAIAVPLQDNFQHLNIETILLALILAMVVDLADGRDRRAGVWLGMAIALKAFPALLLLWLAYRGRWRTAGVAVALAAGLTYVALLPFGVVGALSQMRDWVTLSLHSQSQAGAAVSALHMEKLARLTYALGGGAVAVALAHVAVIAAVAWLLARRPPADDTPLEAGAVLLLAVLIAPIAWLHTFTLAFPVWVAAIAHRPALAGNARIVWTAALALAGLLTSGMLGHIHFPAGLAFVPAFNDVVGSLLLIALLVVQRTRRLPSVLAS